MGTACSDCKNISNKQQQINTQPIEKTAQLSNTNNLKIENKFPNSAQPLVKTQSQTTIKKGSRRITIKPQDKQNVPTKNSINSMEEKLNVKEKEELYGELGSDVSNFLNSLYEKVVDQKIKQQGRVVRHKEEKLKPQHERYSEIINPKSILKNQMRSSTTSVSSANHRIKRQSFVRLLKQNINQKYQFLQKLGQGAYGSVFKAQCKFTKQLRAIKIIKKKSIKSTVDSFFSQLEILKILDHPNIIKLYQIFEYLDFYYVVIEYCEGGELFETVKKTQRFTQKKAASIMKQILSAVKYLHQKNIVHRDLKPQNIVLEYKRSEDNIKQPPIKIIDFGTAKSFKENQVLTTRVGSPYYVAPEVLKQSYNQKCDIWSCGIILYVLLCGQPPFKGRTQKQIFENIQKAKVPMDDKIWSKISIGAKNLITQMLDRNVSRRPSADQCLKNKWISDCQIIEAINPEILENLESFVFKNKFVAVIQTFLATSTISQEQRRQLANKFKEIDLDNSGYIEVSELFDAYKQIYGVSNHKHIQEIIQKLDTMGTGKIDFTEFILANYNHQKLFKRQSLEQAFGFFDKDNTGFLEVAELKEILGGANEEQVKQIMDDLDGNHDGKISKEQFINKMLQYK